ncbi:hypothetical protein BBBOND_0200500 [Babesia bigemina]|uniref:Extracellular matrix-binding ebh n=1 Tax=Babesia bigemina TaxID=5866 RepID=A0A061D2R1_BABBI|nr:hypothetical protein BBBOND_0200500 [Babesia bigemina]CDR94893.1 hypothetical protein BBBOND_0200500 [Babesia bigemina]|eukprot:XP_012767079.1 hypothetical protein BBBOND_0200500 [Babesia bigemina]
MKEGRDNVERVAKGLTFVSDDLEKWREAAHTVLSTAVDNAVEVHKALDPARNSSTLGTEIHKIDTARQGIVDANKELESQVKSLNKWIQDAEDIRQKAETKAREAYDKLSVHEELSKNVKKIMEAKEKIVGVNKSVNTHIGSLKQWNEKAKEVLDGAVTKAQEVHNRLKDNVGLKVEEIKKSNEAIKEANAKLGDEVANLGNWNTAARKVIEMADKKCDEILKRVDKNHNQPKDVEIYKQAKHLQDHGKKLLKAAKDAKQKVESKVKEALDAVKDMDADLKKDLKVVKDKIKEGIKDVMSEFKVGDLGKEVEKDLKQLRERIVKLSENGKADGLFRGQLKALDQETQSVKQRINKIKSETDKQLEDQFRTKIKEPLDVKVKAVEEAIAKVYERFNSQDGSVSSENKKKLQKIFEHIRGQVADIKGMKGGNTGLDGIVANVKGLYNAFVQGNGKGVDARVDGWLGSILGINENQRVTHTDGMKAVTSWIKEYNGKARRLEDALKIVKDQIKGALSSQIKAGQRVITQQDVEDNIVKNLTKVKEACRAFVEELDKKLTDKQITQFANPIVSTIQSRLRPGQRLPAVNDEKLTAAVRAALIALCSCVKQVAAEVDYLGISLFGTIIDETKQAVDDRHGKLARTTNTGTPGKANPDPGTAQAVDKAIEGVKEMVDNTIKEKFENEVKKPVEEAVNGLDTAVQAYDKKAREQVKDAAKGAIDKAANVISDSTGKIELGGNNKLMKNFSNAHKEITTNLKPKLEKLLNDHIGRDDTRDGKREQIKLSRDFKRYDDHVSIGSLTDYVYGRLSLAIEKVRDEGLTDINKHVGKRAGDRTEEIDITGSCSKVEKELKDIVDLLTHNDKIILDYGDITNRGVKTLLTELDDGLTKPVPGVFDKGLETITKVIGDLQRDTFDTKSKTIEEAAAEIRKEVEVLKKKLLSDGGNDDVINALKGLKDTGMSSGTWNGKGGSPIDGLKKIESELERYNEVLGKQPGIIGDAVYGIRDALARIKIKLNEPLTYDDVVHHLTRLEKKIGIGDENNEYSLQKIIKAINKLRAGQFSVNPKAIQRAAGEFIKELRLIQYVLKGERNNDVIITLSDLKNVGLSVNDWHKHENAKGLHKIENELKLQQSQLNGQPKLIGSGVEQIANVLEEVRTALQSIDGGTKGDVINRLGALLRDAFNGSEWQNGRGKKITSLGKIKQDLHQQKESLAQQYETIDKATESVMHETQDMLRKASQKLSSDLISDTIVKNLQLLEKMIVRGQNGDDSLQGMYEKISGLQNEEIHKSSEAIFAAKQQVGKELKRLKDKLQIDVSNKLEDLVINGFGLLIKLSYLIL